jgi:hypothetical protein
MPLIIMAGMIITMMPLLMPMMIPPGVPMAAMSAAIMIISMAGPRMPDMSEICAVFRTKGCVFLLKKEHCFFNMIAAESRDDGT